MKGSGPLNLCLDVHLATTLHLRAKLWAAVLQDLPLHLDALRLGFVGSDVWTHSRVLDKPVLEIALLLILIVIEVGVSRLTSQDAPELRERADVVDLCDAITDVWILS